MSVPQSFKAAVIPQPGAQHEVQERSLAPLAPGEVGIKITATAINPVDWKMRDYRVFLEKFPAVAGSDAAGEIVAIGPDVAAGWSVGDRVCFQGIIGHYDSSTFQQYCKMPAALLSRTPRNVTDESAAGVHLATMAAVTALYDATGHGLAAPWDLTSNGTPAGHGQAIVVLGGSSSVGQYAIQLARLSGFSRIVTNSSAAHISHLKALGAHVVLDRATQSRAADFAMAVGGDGDGKLPLAFVLDAISSAETQLLGVEILRETGTRDSHVVVVQGVDRAAEKAGKELQPPVVVKQVLGLGSSPALRHLSEPMAKHLGGPDGYLATGKIVPNRAVVVPGGLGAIETALAKNKNGVSGEKVVIRPFDS